MRDLIAFVIRHEQVFVAAALGTMVSLVQLLPNWPNWANVILAVTGFSVTIGLLFHDARHLSSRWNGWALRAIIPAFPGLQPEVIGLASVLTSRFGSMARDDLVDDSLAHTTLPLKLSSENYTLPPGLRESSAYILRRTTSARWPFNGSCLRLDTDLTTASIADRSEVVVRRVSFFDGLCSNELTSWEVHRSGKVWPFREEFLFNQHGSLLPLAESRLANLIGVSTLAVTSDAQLLLTLQSKRSSASAELWAPSGSGSLEPRDLVDQETLQSAVICGMQRELQEECGLRDADLDATRVIGFGRWLDRGGKPEFFGVTKLKISAATVIERKTAARDEQLWTQKVVCMDPASIGQNAGVNATWASNIQSSLVLQGSSSLPLLACLHSLDRRLQLEPSFLGDPSAGVES